MALFRDTFPIKLLSYIRTHDMNSNIVYKTFVRDIFCDIKYHCTLTKYYFCLHGLRNMYTNH